jgi:hypothetical protein
MSNKEVSKPGLFSQKCQQEWSETHKYKHIHTGEYCTFEAYVAEYIVLRRAEKLNLGKPAYKFWTKGDPNHWIWMKQFNAARTLKKKYSEEAVLRAIKSKEFDKLLVLGIQNGRGYKINPLAEKVVALYHNRIAEESKKITQEQLNIPEEQDKKEISIRKLQYVDKNTVNINHLRNL